MAQALYTITKQECAQLLKCIANRCSFQDARQVISSVGRPMPERTAHEGLRDLRQKTIEQAQDVAIEILADVLATI